MTRVRDREAARLEHRTGGAMSATTNGRGQAPVAIAYEHVDVPASMTLAAYGRELARKRTANKRRWRPWRRH
jgi:hypothetical protein